MPDQTTKKKKKATSGAAKKLEKWCAMTNVAEELDDNTRKDIARLVKQEYEYDKNSRLDWEKGMDIAIQLVRMPHVAKDYPYENASNVVMPLLAQAAIQFSARAIKNVFKEGNICKGKVIGKDDERGTKASSAVRVAQFTNYQLTEEMPEWMPETDKALFALPVLGCIFKKTFRLAEENRNYSEYVSPEELIIHYFSKSIETAKRITHWIERTKNELVERVRSGVFLDVIDKLGEGDPDAKTSSSEEEEGNYVLLEQHRWYDLDGDGYKEPWIVTIHAATEELLRVRARFKPEDIFLNPKGEIAKIKPRQMFTQWVFMPSIDHSIYGFGFGQLLSHPNNSINSIINELIDAGHWHNTNAGLATSDLGLDEDEYTFVPNEIKTVSTVEDIRKKIFLLPSREPSMALFHTLGLLYETYKKLGMNVDVLTGGKQPSNQPATTTLALIEQGLELHTSVMQRVTAGLTAEMKKLYALNSQHLSEKHYYTVMDTQQRVFAQDFNPSTVDIGVSARPDDVLNIQQMLKADKLMEMRQTVAPPIAEEIFDYWLEAMQIEDRQRFKLPDDYKPPPDPEAGYKLAEIEVQKMQVALDREKIGVEHRKLDIEEKRVALEEKGLEMDNAVKKTDMTQKMVDIKNQRDEAADKKKDKKKKDKPKAKKGAKSK